MDLTSVTLEIWRMLEVCCIALAFLVPLKKKESRWVRRAVICIALGGLVLMEPFTELRVPSYWQNVALCMGVQLVELSLRRAIVCRPSM